MTDPESVDLRERAIERLQKKRDFQAHLLAYLTVNAVLIAVWAMTGSGLFWPAFPMLGWGVGVFFHAWDTYARGLSEERIGREMDRLRRAGSFEARRTENESDKTPREGLTPAPGRS